jgi:cytochrome c553
MQHKKLLIVTALFALMVVGMAATNPPDDGPKNLKVLPKNISGDDLHKIMDGWKTALGVKCNFCHAPAADTTNHHLDFASDAKPEKDMARRMYKMAGKINKKFFKEAKDDKGNSIAVVTCITCHHGNPHPDEVK